MKILNKQNFVKGKITKYECISFAIIFIKLKLIYVKITFICEKGHGVWCPYVTKKLNKKEKTIISHNIYK